MKPRYRLDSGFHEAFMAGQYKADREHYLTEARRESLPQVRCNWVRFARQSHHRYLQFLAMALKTQKRFAP